MQLGEHSQSTANSIPPAEVALNLAVGEFERNGEICIEGVGDEKYETFYLETMFEIRIAVEPEALLCTNIKKIIKGHNQGIWMMKSNIVIVRTWG